MTIAVNASPYSSMESLDSIPSTTYQGYYFDVPGSTISGQIQLSESAYVKLSGQIVGIISPRENKTFEVEIPENLQGKNFNSTLEDTQTGNTHSN